MTQNLAGTAQDQTATLSYSPGDQITQRRRSWRPGAPSSFPAQPVVAYYTTADDPLIVDVINASGAAVFGENIPPSAEDLTVTGTLSGAEATTSSDLPDVITVTDAAGAAHAFEIYIMPELVAVNGQQVTARYRPNERREITLLRVVGAD